MRRLSSDVVFVVVVGVGVHWEEGRGGGWRDERSTAV